MSSVMFSPLRLRDVTLRNRIVVSPMQQYCGTAGYVDEWHLINLSKFAAGGAGLVFFESTKVDPRGCSTPKDAGLWKDDYIPSLAKIASAVKRHGAIPGIQLSHAGRKARRSVPWEGRMPLLHCPGVDHGEEWELIGPSAIAHAPDFAVPREMTYEDIQEVLDAWGAAARRAHQAGFEALELLGGHGYLIHQFLSSASNLRGDEYGGSLEGRMRFAIELVQRVRRWWPASKPLFFRMSVADELGWGMQDSIRLALALKENGVDVIDCSSGGMAGTATSEMPLSYGYQVPHARQLRAGADMLTMAVGLIIHADQAENILRAGDADLVAIGREFLHNPNWPLDAAQKLGVENAFALVPPVYGYYLEKRARNQSVNPSTWQKSLRAEQQKGD